MHTISLVNNDSASDQQQQQQSDHLQWVLATYKQYEILRNLIPSQEAFVQCINNLLRPGTVFDFIVENERGFNLYGFQFFSSSILTPGYDPANLTNLNNEPIMSFNFFPLQNENEWKWAWDQWHVLMFSDSIGLEGDSDEKGWYYSNSFQGGHWRGKFKILGCTFVRRRLWIRLREKIEAEDT